MPAPPTSQARAFPRARPAVRPHAERRPRPGRRRPTDHHDDRNLPTDHRPASRRGPRTGGRAAAALPQRASRPQHRAGAQGPPAHGPAPRRAPGGPRPRAARGAQEPHLRAARRDRLRPSRPPARPARLTAMAIAVPQPPSTTRPAFTPSPATWPTEYREAIVVGAGPAGLAVAAELRRRGVETLLVERSDAVGASWRGRYEGLRLNTMRVLSSLPGHPMPRAYGRYPRREDFVAYLEVYARRCAPPIRFGVNVERVERGPGGWELHTNAGALRARHLVIATGYDAAPRMPDWPGADSFPGELIHASAFRSARAYHGRDVLVVGAGKDRKSTRLNSSHANISYAVFCLKK